MRFVDGCIKLMVRMGVFIRLYSINYYNRHLPEILSLELEIAVLCIYIYHLFIDFVNQCLRAMVKEH